MTQPPHDLGLIRKTFPDWSCFRSDAGIFYATRRGTTLSNTAIERGLQQTVSADDVATFVELLRDQGGRRTTT
ncbi:hypothetical protein [Nonomuraea diastatica]|uniref:Uncharacterized protein n=1 Tax=Nonomuraea diastatica TaxID=1848329 RepID=A0A4R4W0I9_9ACTN|nr:hypothetical protein [Nonomuraea diastatica]TDD08405.1 hypothetical protein E1294_47550 [Nonomuraea diastatica]